MRLASSLLLAGALVLDQFAACATGLSGDGGLSGYARMAATAPENFIRSDNPRSRATKTMAAKLEGLQREKRRTSLDGRRRLEEADDEFAGMAPEDMIEIIRSTADGYTPDQKLDLLSRLDFQVHGHRHSCHPPPTCSQLPPTHHPRAIAHICPARCHTAGAGRGDARRHGDAGAAGAAGQAAGVGGRGGGADAGRCR